MFLQHLNILKATVEIQKSNKENIFFILEIGDEHKTIEWQNRVL